MGIERTYTTRRTGIVLALAELLKQIDGTGTFQSNLQGNIFTRLIFIDELPEFPAVCLTAGTEYRKYQGGGYKDRFVAITIRIFVEEEDAQLLLDKILEDIETILEENAQLSYYDKQGNQCKMHQISLEQIDTDEGVLEPIGLADMSIVVQY